MRVLKCRLVLECMLTKAIQQAMLPYSDAFKDWKL